VIERGTESAVSPAAPFSRPSVDRFEEWLRAPAPLESKHPRFDIRRAVPAEFDRIYDLVDDTFGVKRSRSQYDWIYRRNPGGTARCWVVFDRTSGRLVHSRASWPWPLARGTRCLDGFLNGDSAVARESQRQGIHGLRSDAVNSHAWQPKTVAIGWPNDISRQFWTKRRATQIVGPFAKAILLLNAKRYLAEHKWPTLLSAAGGAVIDTALMAWGKVVLRNHAGLAVKAVRRFESSFDEVTERCMTWPGFWSPHDSDFLNWRYLEHPSVQYLAFALMDSCKLAGYYVLKIDRQASWLMELVTPVSPRRLAAALLLHLVETARSAGCTYLSFSAPPKWRHWKLLHSVGFLPVHSDVYLWLEGEEPGLRQLPMWQLVPGDMDWG
jgi:hypothetical protein